jgi:hypothetical protein
VAPLHRAGRLARRLEPSAIALCLLWAEFRSAPDDFPAAKHGMMRAYARDLGLTDERARQISHGRGVNDKFFD